MKGKRICGIIFNAKMKRNKKYLKEYSYDDVRTTNMGSLYKLTLSVVMKENASSREFLDELRTLNGNLDISLGRMVEPQEAL